MGAEIDATLLNGLLSLGDTFEIDFDIKLPRIEPFRFFVDAFSVVAPEDDIEPPTITASVAPDPNAAGWLNTDALVTFDCTDTGSGIASCTEPITVDAEGEGQVITGTGVDNAGNTASTSITLNIDKTAPLVEITSHINGQTLDSPEITLSGTVTDALSGVAEVTCNGVAASVIGSEFTCVLTLSQGLNSITVKAKDVAGNLSAATIELNFVPPDTTPPPPVGLSLPEEGLATTDFTPTFVWTEVTDESGVFYQLQVDDDPDFSSPEIDEALSATSFTVLEENGLPIGGYSWRVRPFDGLGNLGDFSEARTFDIVLPPQAVLESVAVSPQATRFSEADAELQLTVIGTFSNDATQVIITGSTGTTYESSNRFVASVNDDGLVSSIDNGSTTVTAFHNGFSNGVVVTVEIGVTLESLQMTPQSAILRTDLSTQQLEVVGTFSDGSVRDLTDASSGTTYEIENPSVVDVSGDGVVTSGVNGTTMVTAFNEGLSDDIEVSVAISGGSGFIRGEVYNDSLGLPLAGATIALLADGGGTLATPITTTTDERGQYIFPGLEGDALVRVEKQGFTSVVRRGFIPRDTALTLLDARLTPLDPNLSEVTSAAARQAQNTRGDVTLDFPAGGLAQDEQIRLTKISNQGLVGRLPAGWSPVSAVDVQPSGIEFEQPATLQTPNHANLLPDAEVSVALYDEGLNLWIARGTGKVSADGQRIEHQLTASGQVVFLVPDGAPFTPPAPIDGSVLQGVALVAIPENATATGEVLPRSAPAGEGARATGKITLDSPGPLPSGTQVQANVSERFDLFVGTSIVPVDFVEDLLVYALPRNGDATTLSTTFPITPSRSFAIHELALGVVQLDVVTPSANVGGTVVGSGGGVVTNAGGDSVEIPAGALPFDTIVDLNPLAEEQLPLSIPADLEFLGAVQLRTGEALTQAVVFSINTPVGLPNGSQVVVAQVIRDSIGARHLKVVALGEAGADRITTQATLAGVIENGEYLFVRSINPLGFVLGTIFAADGSGPQSLALVTADTAPFADVTGADGRYLVAAQVGAATTVVATNLATGDNANGVAIISSRNQAINLDLALGISRPTVVGTTPSQGDVDVPVNTPINVDFSERIDPSTVTLSSVVLELGSVAVDGARTLSANGLSMTFTPDAQLESKSDYTLRLTDEVLGVSGNALVAFEIGFTTVDTSKPPQPEAGQITAGLPDDDGFVLVFGTQGTTEAETGVTATNLRTQETITVLSEIDGSFRLRIAVELGDELALTFRNQDGQEQTIAITQLEDPDGSTGIGSAGGVFADADGRVGRILPRALTEAGVFNFGPSDASELPALPSGFSYADDFTLVINGGAFNNLASMTLSESQNRFATAIATSAPFEGSGLLIVPPDFLVNGKLNFTAEAVDVRAIALR